MGVGEGGLNGTTEQGLGEGLSAPLRPAYKIPLLCLSPGPTRDMQPTMKFVMDTSKYWFKPSITREQGKRRHSFRGWVTQESGLGPAVGALGHGRGGNGKWQVQGRSVSCRPHDLRKQGLQQPGWRLDNRKDFLGQKVIL